MGYMVASPSTTGPSMNGPPGWAPERPTSAGSSVPAPGVSAGKALYQSAMASMPRQSTLGPGPANGSTSYPGLGGSVYYPTAAEEKEALRYKRAMETASRTQVDAYGNEAAPVPYEALFPDGPSAPIAPILPLNITRSRSPQDQEQDAYVAAASSASPPLPPPPREGRPLNAMEEKERMRQMYEAQDAAARQPGGTAVNGAPLVPPPHSLLNGSRTPAPRSPPPTPSPTVVGTPQTLTADQEKALLKARYAAEDAAQNGSGPPPLPPPPRSGTTLPPLPPPPIGMRQSPPPPDFSPSDRSMPAPPPFSSVAKPMTAAEEKAQLRAKYSAEEAGDPGAGGPPSSYFPRPPLPTPNGHAHTNHGGDDDADGKPEYLRRDPTISRGKRRATDNIPPPPPLPQKPPAGAPNFNV